MTLPRSAEKALGSVTAALVRYPAPPRMLERLHDRLANFPGNIVGYTPLPVEFLAACHGAGADPAQTVEPSRARIDWGRLCASAIARS